jgi:hypothetical protein
LPTSAGNRAAHRGSARTVAMQRGRLHDSALLYLISRGVSRGWGKCANASRWRTRMGALSSNAPVRSCCLAFSYSSPRSRLSSASSSARRRSHAADARLRRADAPSLPTAAPPAPTPHPSALNNLPHHTTATNDTATPDTATPTHPTTHPTPRSNANHARSVLSAHTRPLQPIPHPLTCFLIIPHILPRPKQLTPSGDGAQAHSLKGSEEGWHRINRQAGCANTLPRLRSFPSVG